MPKSDSGLIDLIAIDRDARAAEQQAHAAQQRRVVAATPSSAPMTRDVGSLSDDEDLQRLAASMASPWQRVSRARIAVGAGALVVVLLGIAAFSRGDDSLQVAASAAPASMPAPPPPAIPPTPLEPPKPAVVAAAPSTSGPPVASTLKADKSRRPAAAARKTRNGGPKMTKVTSSGVAL